MAVADVAADSNVAVNFDVSEKPDANLLIDAHVKVTARQKPS
jgi:hypothetical protein